MKDKYDIVIGLEIHAELNTKSKVFCHCKNEFGNLPNSNICPICVGIPGSLPLLNKHAVELTIMAGLAIGSEINDKAIFERKNYFYPDLSKAYQISQLERPICLGGSITLESGKTIRVNRIHLEEDAGKLSHSSVGTLVDYNRGGVSLIETVTEPDISSAEEAVEFLTTLRNIFVFSDIAKCRMEQGGMRFDVNLSIKPKGQKEYGIRTEMKNLNSFRSVSRAIEFESQRQMKILEEGGTITQETRKWDDDKGISYSLREKDNAIGYRYFADPNILTVKIKPENVEAIRKQIPLLPTQRQEKYINEFNLPEYDAKILTQSKEISDLFDQCVTLLNEPKEISNWIMTDVLKLFTQDSDLPISAKHLTQIIKLVLDKKISRNNAKEIFAKVCEEAQDPVQLATSLGMLETIKSEDIEKIVDNLIAGNPQSVTDYKANPERVLKYFIGGVMRETKGKADATTTQNIIEEKLSKF